MMDKRRLLIVEDDPNLGQILKEYLELKGYDPTLCIDGVEGVQSFKNQDYDLCILDVMLPKKDGFSVAEEINSFNKEVPFIFLTAKNMKQDTIKGLKIGADDYLTKPFSMEELLLRLEVIFRRNSHQNHNLQELMQIGSFTFDYDQHHLTYQDETIQLTSKEADLLYLLAQNKNQLLDRSRALKKIWKDDNYFNARSMDVYITRLRKHLKKDKQVKILTIHGQGYKLVEIK